MLSIHEQLELDRKGLLDLTLRNKLINFKLTRAQGIQIDDEKSDELYRILVLNGKSMDFLAIPEMDDDLVFRKVTYFQEDQYYPRMTALVLAFQTCEIVPYTEAAEDGEQPADDAQSKDPSRHTDNHLQTPYSDFELQKRLLETAAAAREHIEEKGVNVLYLALGELHWYQEEKSEQVLRAPLILVPIEINRKSIDARFMIRYDGAGINDNPALREKLKLDFKITIPPLASEESDEADIKPSEYFQKIREAVALKAGWTVVEDAINVASFSFNKLLMFKDLDSAQWPVNDQPSKHPIISQLLQTGFSDSVNNAAPSLSREEMDGYLALNKNNHIIDADSTQAQAVQAVSKGKTIAIQGPPGTGKSQTIANIIAEAVGNGKTVLFVAEKLAALEVVKRRLEKVGFGDLCLELHSHKAKRKAVIDELNRVRSLHQPKPYNAEPLKSLGEIRATLNAYSDAVNTPVNQTRVTPYRAFGELLRLSTKMANQDWPSWSNSSAVTWTDQAFVEKRSQVEVWKRTIEQYGQPHKNLFWGCEITTNAPNTANEVRRLSRKALEALENLERQTRQFAVDIHLGEIGPAIEHVLAVAKIAQALAALIRSPDACLNPADWKRYSFEVDQAQEACQQLISTAAAQAMVSDAERFAASDFEGIASTIKNSPSGLFSFLNGKLRAAKRDLQSMVTGLPGSREELLVLLDKLTIYHGALKQLQKVRREGQYLFGDAWKSASERPDVIIEMIEAGNRLRRAAQSLPGVSDAVSHPQIMARTKENRGLIEAMAGHVDEFEAAARELFERVSFIVRKRFGVPDLADCNTQDMILMLQSWTSAADEIANLAEVNRATATLQNAGLKSFVEATQNWPKAAESALELFDYAYFDALVNYALETRPALANFQRLSHEDKLNKFRMLDKELLTYNKTRTLMAHYQKTRASSTVGQAGILQKELAKTRRWRTIRRLIADAYDSILRLKPIFMMSPLSVANYLQPGTVQFDLVVFDEASQIRPADAYGAILRGKQVVVVGDSRQLPPTSFFDSGGDVEEDEASSNYESILGKFNSQGVPDHMLRWHYRSAHETLIAVSNQEFYENRLLLAPSPLRDSAELGLKYRYLPDTHYKPGASVNQGEAEAVAQAVIDHARKYPNLSLGVAAFSIKQTQVIRDAVERLRAADTSTEDFFNMPSDEPFFIKNLENVQGDERDVIFISVGYGKTADGKVSLNFGPLNRDGGERRLNVLITRARLRCEVFTNLSADDLNLEGNNSRGLLGLKRYLKYAETGILDMPVTSGRGADSVFEEMVAERLRDVGYEVHHQIGTAGFFVDLAIVDPSRPGNYLLGIECDGASYHSSASARDRDRLRQNILESKGWKIHRIWSTDWFRNPGREIERVVETVRQIQSGGSSTLPVAATKAEVDVTPLRENIGTDVSFTTQTTEVVFLPYRESARPAWPNIMYPSIDTVPPDLIRKAIDHVILTEAPIHSDVLVKRVAGFFILGNVTQKVKTHIEAHIGSAELGRSGPYIWMKNGLHQPRNRANLPVAMKKQEYVADIEILYGCLEVIRQHQPILPEEVQRQLWNAFGFQRVNTEMKTRTDVHIQKLLDAGHVSSRNQYLTVQEKSAP
ncbi:MAG: DUF3320 domain-containing protein [Pleurocapsa minor GSE-CHR-MK-17-07R]|jgi:very-short-patch-repair endonuclease/DNA polymerase III delta prime subunit|nr:DUF3320 domain-containing protein [Pleurocapsa minor GSE-CHR-MK 17-07R]